ncbi:MAG: ribonuclease III [Candidatus Nealsonbacteria bacterium]
MKNFSSEEYLDNLLEKYEGLEKKLNFKFKNKDLLIQAFVHRSFLNENPNFKLFHNERLEFLGDAILEHIVTEYLYTNYPKKLEGELTSWRAALVNTKMLSKIAKSLGFDDYLLLSQGELKEKGRARQYILADIFESFIGSLYLDQGLNICKSFIEKHLIKELDNIIKEGLYKDAKSDYQEQAQEKKGITPTYRVLKEVGPDHAKEFTVGVYLNSKLIAKGKGLSKQEAEEEAAKNALK